MKLELKPEILEVVKRQGVTATNAGMSRDGQISWIYKAGFIEVTLSHTNKILATWRFGKVLKDINTTITCVTDLTIGGDYILVVATSSLNNQGVLNVFSVGLRKVIRAIEIPHRVTALDVLFTNMTEDVPSYILSKHLQFFSGLVAVGTEGGYIFLVDLCLDEMTVNHSTEAVPKKLSIISPSIVDPKAKREQARLYDKHLAMQLDDECHRQGQFYYRRQDDSIQKVLDEETVTVTSIKYLSQAGTLAVGFNFGSFQLWRLYNPVLDYSSRFSPDGIAISHFVVQEPENDPRNFVYLWVGHDDTTGDSISSLCLYQLCFTRKAVYASFGMYYDELESVCARLDHKLTLDPYSSDTKSTRNSSIINAYAIVNPYYTPPSQLSDSYEEGLHSNDLSLSVFVWRAESKRAGGATKHWMCIFDLNRWYHAQMPHSLRCHGNALQICSYWVACNLDEVTSLTSPSASLLSVGISGDRVLRFINNSPLPPEEHSYPSALQLTSIEFITSDSSIKARCDGWQGQLLCQLAHNGAEILVQPADFYHQCHRARLLPQNYEEIKTNTTEYQRTQLLNMALEHGITSTLVPQCIQQWADGEFTEQGCSLSFLLNWAWNRVVSIKKSWDTTCEMLYDWSGHHLDPRTDWQLECLLESLSSLKQIFSALVSQATPTTERGEMEMEVRQDVINILLLHFNVVRWCVSFNLLPEVDETSDTQSGFFSYPFDNLKKTYTKKRAELGSIKGVVKDFSLLLIDDLLDLQGPQIKESWKTLGGNGLYPPPSIQALVNMYLIEEVSTEIKHAVTLYLLQDLAALTNNETGEAVIVSFIQRFMLSPGLVHQIQGLWFIDHRDFEEGVRHLVNPNIYEDLGGSWQHAAVVNTLLAQSEGKAATRYLHTKRILGGCPQEQQLYISVLLHNREVSQALEYMRGIQNENNSSHLLNHLLNECHRYKLLGHLLQVNLTDVEEIHLEQHLRSRTEPHALEPLFLYYLHHSRFLQAYQLNEDMKKMDRLETSLVAQERAATRNRLMEAFLRALPDVTSKLLMEKQKESTLPAKRVEVQRPKPLSTRVHASDHIAMSRSRFVMAVLEKVTEAQNMVDSDKADIADDSTACDDTLMSKNNVPFLTTPRTPKHKQKSRVSEVIYPELKLSPMATNPLSAIKRKTLLDSKHENQNGNISLKQLTEECLQLLQTPVRNNKGKSAGLDIVDAVSHTKTPQSILKVRRLSKTLLSSSKERTSARRSSGKRSTRFGFTPETSTHGSPAISPSMEQSTASPLLVSTESAAIKQLRFVGLSPSPTPSPTTAPDTLPMDKTSEVTEMENSTLFEDDRPAETVHSLSEEAIPTTLLPLRENLPETRVEESLSEKDNGDSSAKNVSHLENDHLSFAERPRARYLKKLEELSRPDLQSAWKQGQLLGHSEFSQPAAPATTSSNISVNIIRDTRASKEGSLEGMDESPRGRERCINIHTHNVEQVLSSQSSVTLSTSVSHQVIKTRYMQLSVEADLPTPLSESSLSPMKSLSSRRNLSSLVTSSCNLTLKKSSSVSPKSQTTESDISVNPEADSRKNESPPITPPSSKRAKMLETLAKDFVSSRKSVHSTSSHDLSETGDSRRRKTPLRSSSRKPEQEKLEKLIRSTPERKTPLRKQQKLEGEKADKEEERKTPENESPPRKLQKLEENIDEKVESKSPSQKLQKQKGEKVEEVKRKTPERKSPSRKLQKLDEESVSQKLEGEEAQRKTRERKSPARKLQKLEEKIDDEVQRKTPERKSPSRKLQKLEEEKSEKSLRRTPDRQSVTRKLVKLSKSDDDKQMMSWDPEDAIITTYKNHHKIHTGSAGDNKDQEKDEEFEAADDVLDKMSEDDTLPKVQERRRSTRLRTLDRLESLSPARGSQVKAARTPQKMTRKQVEVETKPSPIHRSTRHKVSESEVKEADNPTLSAFAESSGRIMTQSTENAMSPEKKSKKETKGDEADETEVHSLRRTRRQSRTPDRLVPIIDTLEPLTSTKRSKRVPKTSEKMDAVVSEEKLLVTSASPSKQHMTGSKSSDHAMTDELIPTQISISHSRSLKVMAADEEKEAKSQREQLPETTQKSRRKTPDRHLKDTDSEPAEADEGEVHVTRSGLRVGSRKSPARQTKSPARETQSPARQTRSPARETKSPAREKLPARETESPARETESPARETKSPARETKSPARETKSPARETKSSARETKSPARETKSPARETKSPAREKLPAKETKSPAREKLPARETKSPARQTKSPARQTTHEDEGKDNIGREENNDENADEYNEELPPLRFEVEDSSSNEDNQADTDITKTQTVKSHIEISRRNLRDHRKGSSSMISEDPLLPSSPARHTRTPKRPSHEEDFARDTTPAFIFSPPIKHTWKVQNQGESSLEKVDKEQLFVFSHPTVAANTETGGVEVAEIKSKTTPQEQSKKKSKKKRTLLSFSPILLSPLSPVSGQRTKRHHLASQRPTAATKLCGPRARRIKPSTWTQPTTSRQ